MRFVALLKFITINSYTPTYFLFSISFSNPPFKISPVTGPEWPRGFQEVKVPRFHDNGTGWW
jgi:hypothetical protein